MPDITFFSMPKPFIGLYDTIQTNAILSWKAHPHASVVLLGDDFGVRDFAHQQDCHHVSIIKTNDLGTPLVSDVVRQATAASKTRWMAYVNADIIIPPSLGTMIDSLLPCFSTPVVFACRRWDIDVTTAIDFSNPNWFQILDQITIGNRRLYGPNGMDLFVFPKGFYDAMPPFSIGWPGAKYDNWFVWYARRNGVPVVDITDAITLFHQRHPVGGGSVHPDKSREHLDNLKLLGGYGNCFDIRDASHRVNRQGQLRRAELTIAHIPLKLKRIVQRTRDFFIL